MTRAIRPFWLMIVAGLLLGTGCSKSEPEAAPDAKVAADDAALDTGDGAAEATAAGTASKSGASASKGGGTAATADAAVNNVAQGLLNNRPQVMWESLPASYQTDANSLVHDFAAKMDAEVWNRTFLVLRKLVTVLEAKRELIVSSPQFAQAAGDPERNKQAYDSGVALLKLTVNSDLSDLEKLKSFDGQTFLAGTGSQMVERIRQLAALTPGDSFAKLEQVKATLVSSEGDTAVVRIEAPGEEPEEEEFVKVEGKWIPKEMATNWKNELAEAREGIASIAPEQMETQKKQYLMLLDAADENLDTLNKAETSEEFAQLAQQAVFGLMGQAMMAFQPQEGAPGSPTTSEGVTILITRELPDEELDVFLSSLEEGTENVSFTASPFAGQTMIQVTPVADVEAFSKQIKLGKVTEVNVEERTITVEATPEQLKPTTEPAPTTDPATTTDAAPPTENP